MAQLTQAPHAPTPTEEEGSPFAPGYEWYGVNPDHITVQRGSRTRRLRPGWLTAYGSLTPEVLPEAWATLMRERERARAAHEHAQLLTALAQARAQNDALETELASLLAQVGALPDLTSEERSTLARVAGATHTRGGGGSHRAPRGAHTPRAH